MTPVVAMRNITKEFSAGGRTVVANDGVDLTVKKGEIHAVVGENGAGKTTLMNVLYGMFSPDEGHIEINGERVMFDNPRDAIAHRIGMVHQHFMLVPSLSVLRNVVLGYEPTNAGVIDEEAAERSIRQLSDEYGLDIEPEWVISDLSVGVQQRCEILKVLYRGAEILILDEPTAVLTPQETRDLFRAMRSLVDRGATILFITHKLREVIEATDVVTVMRDGHVVGTMETKDTSEQEIARLMVGRELNIEVPEHKEETLETVFEVQDLNCLDDRGLHAVRGVSFRVGAGEIVGIAGVARNGQEELAEALIGAREIESGRVLLDGQDISGLEPRSIKELGVGHIPDDRYEEGCAKEASTWKNIIMAKHYRPPLAGKLWIDVNKARDYSMDLINRYDVRTSDQNLPIGSLSGGNIQKAIVAREMSLAQKLLIAEQPSRGIDIGASNYIHRQLVKMRDKGLGILLISMDLQEILLLSSRILVMYEGKIQGECHPAETSEEELGLLMAGVDPD